MDRQQGTKATVSTVAAVVSVVAVCLVNLAGTSYLAGQVVEQVKGLQLGVAKIDRTVDNVQRRQSDIATDVAVINATLRAKGFDIPVANVRRVDRE